MTREKNKKAQRHRNKKIGEKFKHFKVGFIGLEQFTNNIFGQKMHNIYFS